MGMTLKELLTKGEGTLTAGEAKTLASQCRMDVETLFLSALSFCHLHTTQLCFRQYAFQALLRQ